jgi:hypothetical protein
MKYKYMHMTFFYLKAVHIITPIMDFAIYIAAGCSESHTLMALLL